MDELASYDYDLPPELIATEPLPQRDSSRMLVVDRQTGTLRHRQVRDLPEILRPGDRLVLERHAGRPRALFGSRTATGGKWEGLFLEALPSGQWRLIGQSGGRLQPGDAITVVPAHGPASMTNGRTADADAHRTRRRRSLDGQPVDR